MRAKRKRQRRVIVLSKHSFLYDPVDKLRPRNLGTHRERVSKTILLLVKEDKAPLGSDPSALAMPYGSRFRRDKLRAASICGAVLSRQVGMPEAPMR